MASDLATGPATTLICAGTAHPMRPWPRYLLTSAAWRAMAHALRSDPSPAFLALWADTDHVHALFMADAPLLASVRVEAGLFDALSPARPAAAPFERMVHDLWGHLAGDGVDPRPLLDQGCWPVLRPLSDRPVPNTAPPDVPEFLGVAGHGLQQIPVGPIGGLMDPAHLRITAAGETALRVEARLGYAHRGILALMCGKPLPDAAAVAARIAAESTVAHSIAFARAAEAATGVGPPPRGRELRDAMAELERIAAHLDSLAAAMPGVLAARCGDLRERVMRASHAAFGHRLLMDLAIPGGTSADLTPAGGSALFGALDQIVSALAALRRFHRLRTMLGGNAGEIGPRIAELSGCLRSLRSRLDALPPGPVGVALPPASGEGLGAAAGPRGNVWHWLRLDAGVVAANFACDPAWLRWPSIEAACQGVHLSDVPRVLRPFGPGLPGLEL